MVVGEGIGTGTAVISEDVLGPHGSWKLLGLPERPGPTLAFTLGGFLALTASFVALGVYQPVREFPTL